MSLDRDIRRLMRGTLRPPPVRETLETVWVPEARPDPALRVACPRCEAPPGSVCVTVGFDQRTQRDASGEPREAHQARRSALRKERR